MKTNEDSPKHVQNTIKLEPVFNTPEHKVTSDDSTLISGGLVTIIPRRRKLHIRQGI
jgi:hypothetical protein